MRFVALAAAAIGAIVLALLTPYHITFALLSIPCLVLCGIGIWDLLQTRHSIRRNYPILAHIRFALEKIRPEIRQYFLESDTDGTPFNRSKRAVAYQRAKGALDKRPFGTQQDIYGDNFEWINHSIVPHPPATHDFRVTVGGTDCRKPYALVAVQRFRHELRRAQRERHSRAQPGAPSSVGSRTTPAKAGSVAITASSAAT